MPITTIAIAPAANGLRRGVWRRLRGHQGLPSVAACWVPGTLPITVRPAR